MRFHRMRPDREEYVPKRSTHFCFLARALQLEKIWVAVKELKLSYCIGETLLFTIYTHYGNLI